MKTEKIFKSNIFQVIIPLDSTLEKIIDRSKYSIKDFKDEVYLVEELDNNKEQKNEIQS